MTESIREAAAIYQDIEDMEATVQELQQSGIDRAEISMLASRETVETKIGDRYQLTEQLIDDETAPRRAPVDIPSVREGQTLISGIPAYLGALTAGAVAITSGGAVASIAIAVLAGGSGGALLGAAGAKWLGDQVSQDLEAQLARGGIALWVTISPQRDEATIRRILARRSDGEPLLHNVPAVQS